MTERSEAPDNAHGSITVLEELRYDELRDWIERVLTKSTSEYVDTSTYDDIDEAVLDLVRGSSNLCFQQRFRNSVVELIDSWSTQYAAHTLDYLYRLIIVVGGLKLARCRRILEDFATSERFKGKTVLGQDLHQTILRVIWGLGIRSPRTKMVFTREIEKQTNYTVLCFNALAETDLIGSLEYLPARLRYTMQNESGETSEAWNKRFGRLIGNAELCGPSTFRHNLLGVFRRLNLEETEFLLRTLTYNNVQFGAFGSYRGGENQTNEIVVRWSSGSSPEPIKNPTLELMTAVRASIVASIDSRLEQTQPLILQGRPTMTNDN